MFAFFDIIRRERIPFARGNRCPLFSCSSRPVTSEKQARTIFQDACMNLFPGRIVLVSAMPRKNPAWTHFLQPI